MKILGIKNPKARKEHVCEVCGGKIAKGERYQSITMTDGRKISVSKRHLKCHEQMKTSNESDFKKEMAIDTNKMLDVFSFKENMEIAFFPLVITEIAWNFAFKVLDLAARDKISETKKMSRAVKMLREKYVKDCMIDLDRKHFDHITESTEKFMETCGKDFTILYFSTNNELKRTSYDLPYLDMRTYAYMSLAMIDVLVEHNKNMDKLIQERLGDDTRLLSDGIPMTTKALKECMEAYMSPAQYVRINHIQTSIKILLNKISQCEFVLT